MAVLLTWYSVAYAAQNSAVSCCRKHIIPITHNFNLTNAIHRITRAGNGSASAQGYYTFNNPVAFAGVGTGTIGANSTLGQWEFGTVSGGPDAIGNQNFNIIAGTRAGLFDQNANNEQSIGETGVMLTAPYYNNASQSGGWVWSTNNTASNFTVELKVTLVRDILYYEYDITNLNGDIRQVGFDWTALLNTISSEAGNIPTYYVPTVGSITTVQDLTGAQVPDHWFVRDGTPPAATTPPVPPETDNHPPLKFEQFFNGNNSRPAQLVFGNSAGNDDLTTYNWQAIFTAQNNQVANPVPLINNGDALTIAQGTTAYECLYPISSIGAGQTQTITGQIQCNVSSVNTVGAYPNQGVLAAALFVPEFINPPVNSQTAYTDPVVIGDICNSTQAFNTTATVTLNIGSGFTIAQGSATATTSVSTPFPVNELTDKQVSLQLPAQQQQPLPPLKWTLQPVWSALSPQNYPNGYPITLTVSCATGGTISTTAYIDIPASASSESIPSGMYFFGLPYNYSTTTGAATTSASTVFNTANLPNLELAWWNPQTPGYEYLNDSAYSNTAFSVQPGSAYWVNNKASTAAQPGQGLTATPIPQSQTVSVALSPGWNAISDPYQYPIVWGYCHVLYNYKVYSLSDAIRLGMIRAELWSWDSSRDLFSAEQ